MTHIGWQNIQLTTHDAAGARLNDSLAHEVLFETRFSLQTGTVAVPQTVVYNPSHRGIRKLFAHWLRPDGKTFCGRDPKRSVGWEPFYDASPYRMCGRCMRSARGATQKISGGSTPR